MVGAIGPTVSGNRKRSVSAIFVASLVAGSTTMALVLISVGTGARAVGGETVLTLIVLVACGVTLFQILATRTLQSSWQVPEIWRRHFEIDILAAAYGYILGLGFPTAVVVSAFWIFVALTLAAPAHVALIGWIAYALVRGLGFLASARRDWENPFNVSRPGLLIYVATLAGLTASSLAVFNY